MRCWTRDRKIFFEKYVVNNGVYLLTLTIEAVIVYRFYIMHGDED
jgi:hypothetical protein